MIKVKGEVRVYSRFTSRDLKFREQVGGWISLEHLVLLHGKAKVCEFGGSRKIIDSEFNRYKNNISENNHLVHITLVLNTIKLKRVGMISWILRSIRVVTRAWS